MLFKLKKELFTIRSSTEYGQRWSTLVGHLPLHPKVKGSSPAIAASTGRDFGGKMFNNYYRGLNFKRKNGTKNTTVREIE